MIDKELSNLSIDRRECPKCGATWIDGTHRWNTGMVGNELDLVNFWYVIILVMKLALIPRKDWMAETHGKRDSMRSKRKLTTWINNLKSLYPNDVHN